MYYRHQNLYTHGREGRPKRFADSVYRKHWKKGHWGDKGGKGERGGKRGGGGGYHV